jgi:hypothetical protein
MICSACLMTLFSRDHLAALSHQYVVCAARCGGVHAFHAYARIGQCAVQARMGKALCSPGAEQQHVRLEREKIIEV